ncbi:unnamed protein product, partial [Cladocopium goreaui]
MRCRWTSPSNRPSWWPCGRSLHPWDQLHPARRYGSRSRGSGGRQGRGDRGDSQ